MAYRSIQEAQASMAQLARDLGIAPWTLARSFARLGLAEARRLVPGGTSAHAVLASGAGAQCLG